MWERWRLDSAPRYQTILEFYSWEWERVISPESWCLLTSCRERWTSRTQCLNSVYLLLAYRAQPPPPAAPLASFSLYTQRLSNLKSRNWKTGEEEMRWRDVGGEWESEAPVERCSLQRAAAAAWSTINLCRKVNSNPHELRALIFLFWLWNQLLQQVQTFRRNRLNRCFIHSFIQRLSVWAQRKSDSTEKVFMDEQVNDDSEQTTWDKFLKWKQNSEE